MIVVATDKFRGTLDADDAAAVIANALNEYSPGTRTYLCPMADGGEGTAQVLFRGSACKNVSPGIYERADGAYAIVSSEIIGHEYAGRTGLRAQDRSSYDLGASIARIAEATRRSSAPIYVCIGGTSTVDGGAGLLQGIGAIFLDKDGDRLSAPIKASDLTRIADVDLGAVDIRTLRERLVILCDVRASLTGDDGLSSLSFAPQKGVSKADLPMLEASLKHFSGLFGHVSSPYDGAGGGTGFALASAIRAKCFDGSGFLLSRVVPADMPVSAFITGEGKIDCQTAGGKVVSAVFAEARKRNVPAFAFGGIVDRSCNNPRYFSTMSRDDLPPASREQAASRLRQAVISHAEEIFSVINGY